MSINVDTNNMKKSLVFFIDIVLSMASLCNFNCDYSKILKNYNMIDKMSRNYRKLNEKNANLDDFSIKLSKKDPTSSEYLVKQIKLIDAYFSNNKVVSNIIYNDWQSEKFMKASVGHVRENDNILTNNSDYDIKNGKVLLKVGDNNIKCSRTFGCGNSKNNRALDCGNSENNSVLGCGNFENNSVICCGNFLASRVYSYSNARKTNEVMTNCANNKTEIDIFQNFDLGCGAVSEVRRKINALPLDGQIETIEKIISMGFSLEAAVFYVYPNLQGQFDELSRSCFVPPTEPIVCADNDCKIIYKNAKNGYEIDKNTLISDFFDALKNNGKITIKTVAIEPQTSDEQIKRNYQKIAEFSTSFQTSSKERKNNIKRACGAINGKHIASGEIFSFNSATGQRTEENGYQTAKIIKNGEYIDGIGGGVCQVSSTLYNAGLLAGLSAVEVHNHSLQTSYVKSGFDAMVNTGSADLRLQNVLQNDVLITASSNQDICKIVIYGVKKNYTIKLRSEKYEDLPAGEDIIETDGAKYDITQPGTYRIVSAIDGLRVKSYIDYYIDDRLVETKQIRDCTYRQRTGVLLVIE